MKTTFAFLLMIVLWLSQVSSAFAQKAPEVGYVFPPGGKAGTTVNVQLGGYEWTPDMEVFVHDKRVQLVLAGAPGPVLIPPPPYWFGAKGRLSALPLPRETPAKFVLSSDLQPGPIHWQAANANGTTSVGVFIVGSGPEVVEDESRKSPQVLASLPMTVSGRLLKNEEVDRYRFVAPKDGPITCDLVARRLGAKFQGILEVHDAKGKLIADALGHNGGDPSLTFIAQAKGEYVVSVRDIDFGGDRSYVYRLSVTTEPRIVGAVPAAGKPGETREVEFIVDNGTPKLGSLKRPVTLPKTGAAPFPLLIDENPGITGVLDQPDAEGRHSFEWKKGEVWSLLAEAKRIGSPLDVAIAVIGPDGKELAKNDDLPGTTDAGLDFTVPADGKYDIVVTDMAGKTGSRAAIYRLVVRPTVRDYSLQIASPRVSVPLGGKFDLPIQVIRKGGFKGPIALTVKGLPAGVSVPTDLVIPGDKVAFAIPLSAAKDAGTTAGLVTIEGTANLAPPGLFSRNGFPQPGADAPRLARRAALARTTVNLAPRGPEDNQVAQVLVASVLKPLFKGQPVDQDTGRKVYRGTTFPAEVIVERLDGWNGEIVLQMSSRQSYQVQGISGGDVIVPPGVGRTVYPCFMPEWLETTRTSRMGMIATAKVADPKGKVRHLVNDMTGFITMTLEGALLKVSADEQDMTAPMGEPFDVHLKVSRLTKLNEPARLELKLPEELAGQLKAEPMVVPPGKEQTMMRITPAAKLQGLHTFTIRATALQDGRWLAVSEASVTVEFLDKSRR